MLKTKELYPTFHLKCSLHQLHSTPVPFQLPQSKQKKLKIRSQSNFPILTDDDISDDPLNPAETLFSDDKSSPITYVQFKYLIESSSNKSVNTRTLCEETNIEIRTLMSLIKKAYTLIKNPRMKSKLTRFLNL